ncbi:nickel-dependent lactate racemase [soil metagenome]
MEQIDLKYGRGTLPFEVPPDRFTVLRSSNVSQPLSDVEIGERFDDPIGSRRLEEVIEPGSSVLFVLPDATRQSGSGQLVNLLVRRLIANGTMPFDIAVIFATGIHRSVTEEEKQQLLTQFIAQRVKTLDHSPRDLMRIARMGETSGGIPVELDRALIDFDHVILIGGITFHYFAGFTGGRKLICPGLASARTIAETHKLAFDCESLARRDGVGPGLLAGNLVHEAFEEAASKVQVSFAVNSIVDERGAVTGLFCGDRVQSHEAACGEYAARHTVSIAEKRDLVVVSCGGWPHDSDLIQAHKAIDAAANACTEGGTIIVVGECAEGLGRDDLLDWFTSANSGELAKRLCQKYQVNGQTAWSLMEKTERFRICAVSSLRREVLKKLGVTPVRSVEEALALTTSDSAGYIVPDGAKSMFTVG